MLNLSVCCAPANSRHLTFSVFSRQYNKHLFVHIGGPSSYEPLEAIGITQIYDKFPDKKGGLRELYDKGPANAFFLVKFWADLNTSIQVGDGGGGLKAVGVVNSLMVDKKQGTGRLS